MSTPHDAELTILGLDPDSIYPICDWWGKKEGHGLQPKVRERWYLHTGC